MRKRYVNVKTLPSRSKTILSGANGDVIRPKESEEPFWLEFLLLPTGSCLECQNRNIKAWHHTWHHTQFSRPLSRYQCPKGEGLKRKGAKAEEA